MQKISPWNAQRYTVSVTYEVVAPDGSSSGASTRRVTMWATSAAMAKQRVEHWARIEFHRPGFVVIAQANDVRLAD